MTLNAALEGSKIKSMNPALISCVALRSKVTGRVNCKRGERGRRDTRSARTLCLILLALTLVLARLEAAKSPPPLTLGATKIGANLIMLPDGSWETYSIASHAGTNQLMRAISSDNGTTWSEPDALRTVPIRGGVVALLDRRGEVQLFVQTLRTLGEGRRIAVDRFIDIWQLRSSNDREKWSEPQKIFEGYVGSVQGALQLRSGRIVLPFAYWVGGRPQAPPTGPNVTTVVFSDDDGRNWTQSAAGLTSPCVADYNGNNYGAIEPTILELKDGRIWMLMRTQAGFLYESFSEDGTDWSEASRSQFHSSNSPAFLARLPDGRIVLFWNNCELGSRVAGQGVYSGRDVLHAAISADEGQSWHGCREVYRDPARNETPPKSGDRGTAYPFAVIAKDGRIALVSGQGGGRRGLVLVDPEWLLQTDASDNFTHGLENWCVFKGFGPVSNWWRDRVPGAKLMDHPTTPGAKVLHIRKADDKAADGAVWNFPSGDKGTLHLRLKLNDGFAGADLALLNRFFDPTDERVPKQAAFHLSINAQGGINQKQRLTVDRWHALELAWDLDARRCQVRVDGQAAALLPINAAVLGGVSYVHLRSRAKDIDPAGWLVESVRVVIDGK